MGLHPPLNPAQAGGGGGGPSNYLYIGPGVTTQQGDLPGMPEWETHEYPYVSCELSGFSITQSSYNILQDLAATFDRGIDK